MVEHTVKPSDDNTHIILKINGEFTARAMMEWVIESHTLGQELGIHGYLVDVRNARNVDTVLGNYQFAYSDMKSTAGVDPQARVAGLISPGDQSHDFVAMVSENAGMNLKLFTDPEEAKHYLRKHRSSSK